MTETNKRLDCGWRKEIYWLQKKGYRGTKLKHEACLNVPGEVSLAWAAIKLARCKYTRQQHVMLASLRNLRLYTLFPLLMYRVFCCLNGFADQYTHLPNGRTAQVLEFRWIEGIVVCRVWQFLPSFDFSSQKRQKFWQLGMNAIWELRKEPCPANCISITEMHLFYE